MKYQRGPHYSGKCPFKIVPEDPISADQSIRHCVDCATEYNKRLKSLKEDFYQVAMLTVLESIPKYNPNHPSGASFTTFIKKRVCTRLWWERKKELNSLPFPHDEQPTDDDNWTPNPLVAGLNAEACAHEALEDEVIRQLEVEQFCEHLPQFLAKLTEKQRRVLEMKYFEECSGVEIAKALGISKGRVSQIMKTALEKVKKAYLLALEKGFKF
ncbi:sigma-70 family RNA polymerase sigma factor [Candidatus Poribacteria bacterium]|nr:sigma-70 family RNA polymerase sigma factor [Candidatus Poribacteria bacterium]